jgi:hypothetical protein
MANAWAGRQLRPSMLTKCESSAVLASKSEIARRLEIGRTSVRRMLAAKEQYHYGETQRGSCAGRANPE